MKIPLKNKNNPQVYEIKEPDKSIEEQLRESIEEIDFLNSQLKLPLQESKNAFKKRYKKLEDELRNSYSQSIEETKNLCNIANMQIEENKSLKEKYLKLQSVELLKIKILQDKESEKNKEIQKLQEEYDGKKLLLEEEFNTKQREFELLKLEYQKELQNKREVNDLYIQEQLEILEQKKHEILEEIQVLKKKNEEHITQRLLETEECIKKSEFDIEKKKKNVFEDLKYLQRATEEILTQKAIILEDEYRKEKEALYNEINELKNTTKENIDREYQKLEEIKEQQRIDSEKLLNEINECNDKLSALKDDIEKKEKINKILNKNLFKKTSIISIIGVIILSIVLSMFRYSIFPSSSLSSSINKLLMSDYREISGNIVLTVNGQTLTKFNIFNGVNKLRGEEYFLFKVSDDNNAFEWERYNKGQAEFIKTPYEPQYVLATNRNDAGWYYNINDSSKLLSSLSYSIISNSSNKNTEIVSEYMSSNVFKNFLTFLKNRIMPDQITYDFAISNDNLKAFYGVLSSSKGYRKFVEEEAAIKSQLKLDNTIEEIDKFLVDLLVNSNIQTNNGKAQIRNGKIENITLNFNGINSNGDNIGMYCSFSFAEKDKNTSYDSDKFIMNSMNYDEVYPRIEQDEFKDLESQGNIQENITTIDALEKEGYEVSP